MMSEWNLILKLLTKVCLSIIPNELSEREWQERKLKTNTKDMNKNGQR